MLSELKRKIFAVLRKIPGGTRLIHLREMRRFANSTKGLSREQIFSNHFETNFWGSPESRSGGGATLAYTENIRKEIPMLIRELGILNILDAPCGDYNWFRHISLPAQVNYVGGDIVPKIIGLNRDSFARDGVRFMELDIVEDPLPPSDLWLCRAVFIHFSNRFIWATLDNFLRSEIRYFLTTSIPGSRNNQDIANGFFRSINLELPPFSFPPPLRSIDDGVSAGEQIKLCLWDRESIKSAIEHNVEFQQIRRQSDSKV